MLRAALVLLLLALATAHPHHAKEDVQTRRKLRSAYSFLLNTAAKVEVTRRHAAKLLASSHGHLTLEEKRLLKDTEMITKTAEKLAKGARLAAGKKPISLAAKVHGNGPLTRYRRAEIELIDAARAVNFLRRKVAPFHPKRATAFVAKFLNNECGDEEALKKALAQEEADLKAAEEALKKARAEEAQKRKDREGSDDPVEDVWSDHQFTSSVSKDLKPRWSLEDEPWANIWHRESENLDEQHGENKEEHEENVEEHEDAKKALQEAIENYKKALAELEAAKKALEEYEACFASLNAHQEIATNGEVH